MERLYIIDPTNFKGHVENTMPLVNADEINNTVVHYSKDVTFEEYNKQHNGKLIALPWDEFNEKYYQPYLQSLQKPFVEITEERYYDLLECLPPQGWRDLNNEWNVFYIMEAYTANLHTHVVKNRKTKKYHLVAVS